MTFSLKQKAMLITAGTISGIIAGCIAITFILANVSSAVIGDAFGVAVLAWFIWLFYSVTLSHLEYKESLNKINESVKKS